MNVLIVAGGMMDVLFARSYIRKNHYDFIIAADHGMDSLVKVGEMPDLILGDFDSMDYEMKNKMKDWNIPVIEFPPEKDYTDTHLALMEAIQRGAKKITLLGATGTRLDHTMANIGLLQYAMEQGVEAEIIDKYNRISMWKHGLSIEKDEQFGKFVSLIPYTEKVTGLTLRGFKYNLEDHELTLGISQGISNEIVEEKGNISFESGCLLVIESRD